MMMMMLRQLSFSFNVVFQVLVTNLAGDRVPIFLREIKVISLKVNRIIKRTLVKIRVKSNGC
jgi:hypothetical protein